MIFFSQTPEVKALKCINLDRWTFFSLLYMNNGLGRRIPFGFWSSVQSPACMLCPKLQNELVTDTGSIPSVQAFLVKTKVWTWPFIWRKNTEKEQISTEDYFDRSKSRNGYIISDSIYFFTSVLSNGVAVLWSFCALIPETLDFKGLRQFLCKLWASSIDIAVR